MKLIKIFSKSNKSVSSDKILNTIQSKNAEKALKLIPHCTDLDSDSGGRATLVECAIIERNLPILDALLEAGASANVQTCIFKLKPFELALERCFFEAATSLAEHGANINDYYDGYTALNRAIHLTSLTSEERTPEQEKINFTLIRTLIKNGADVNKKDKFNMSPLDHVMNSLADEKYLLKLADILRYTGATVNDGMIEKAKENNNFSLAKKLSFSKHPHDF